MNKNSNASPKTPGSQYDRYRGEELPASDTHPLPQPQPLDNTSGTSHGSKTADITASIVRGRDEADNRMSMDDVLRGLNASMLDGGRPPACSAFNTIKQRKIK